MANELTFDVPRFNAFNKPNGELIDNPACHALFYYVVKLKNILEERKADQSYEGDASPGAFFLNMKQLFSSIALAYGVSPEHMLKYWPEVDLQCFLMGSNRVEKQYRFDEIPELKSNQFLAPRTQCRQDKPKENKMVYIFFITRNSKEHIIQYDGYGVWWICESNEDGSVGQDVTKDLSSEEENEIAQRVFDHRADNAGEHY